MSQKKCPSCRTSVPDNAKFCPDCGAPTSKNSAAKSKGAKKSNSTRDMLIIVGVLAVVIVGYFLVVEKDPGPQNPQQQATEHDHPEVEDQQTMNMLANLPTDYNTLVQIGNSTMDQGNYAMAAECYRRALAIEGTDPNVRTDYGACLHGMGLPERAIAEFRTVIDAVPSHQIAHFNMGIVFYTMSKPDSAKVYFKKYIEMAPNGSAAPTANQYLQEIG